MARRKQQNPRHLESSHQLAISMQNGIASSSDSEEDEHVCGRCRAEFPSLSDFLKHKVHCVSKRPVLVISDAYRVDESELKEIGSSNEEDDALSPPTLTSMNCVYPDDVKRFGAKISDVVQRVSDTNVTLEELKNTTVAVAQHGRTLQESQLALLLSNIHNHQLAQLHVIQELQAQIMGSPPKSSPLVGTAALTPPQSAGDGVMGLGAPNCTQPSAPISARTSTIAVGNSIQPNDMPSYEPNTLELLQRHTEQALQNTMSGGSFLLSNAGNSDMTRLKQSKDGKGEDPALRHKCRFCGKVFGSDSGLQIHLRSHTGERPFKCTVCGSCFSTKGNLKVHFQRHKERMEVPSDFQNGGLNHAPVVNGDPHHLEGQQGEKGPDFANDKPGEKSTGPVNGQSRSLTPNDISTLSEDSHDVSGDGDHDMRTNDDDDDHDSNSSALNNNLEGELDSIRMRQPSFTSPTFTSFFRPTTFSGTLPDNPLCLPHPTSTSTPSDSVLHRDPSLYQELLPRIGSNDNSWESLMEVTETSETSKLQKLVDNIEVADPNQCVVCQRVLSCKSALQMHYRTHTGERPFKCKICGRAFTTKGNLKTHMSVHRSKAPTRMLHQCPVCHKQFANSIILQQHIRVHTSVQDVLLPEAMLYAENKNSTLLPPSYPRPMILPPHMESPEPLALTSSESKRHAENAEYQHDHSVKAITNDMSSAQISCVSSPAASTSSSNTPTPSGEEVVAAVNEEIKSLILEQATKNPAQKSESSESSSPINMMTGHRDSPTAKEKEKDMTMCCSERLELTPSPDVKKSVSPVAGDATTQNKISTPDSNNNNVEIKAERAVHPMMVSLANDKPLPMTLPSDCPIRLSVQSERQILPLSTTSEFTASLTALENHVKAINSSTTNPLPFPTPALGLNFSVPNFFRHDYGLPPVPKDKAQAYSPSNSKNGSDVSTDERSTPGSLAKPDSPKFSLARSESGALDLTPRGGSGLGSSSSTQRHTTDLKAFTPLAGLPFPPPPHARIGTTCQICFKTFACQSALEIHYRSHTKERPFKCDVCDRGFSTKGNMKQHMLTHKIRDLPAQLFTSSQPTMVSAAPSSSQAGDEASKRSHPEGGSQATPRKSGLPKHVCEVCHKPFSSGSALQIHMRTHTGVKPFQCNICSRAFTTKGNLKVHMGTHLTNNGSSRRGRRMSLDVSPLSLSLGKHGEFAPRQDMFFPYLPPFMNGMPQPHAKMNEISVIQSAGNREDMVAAAFSMASPSFTPARPLSLVANASQKRQEEELQRRSPARGKDPSSPGRSAADPGPMADRAASWGWKIACNRCNKICSSSTELEMHISQEHMKSEASDNLEQALDKKS